VCFDFLTIFVRNIYFKKKWARCDQEVYWSLCKLPAILVRYYWNNFLRQAFGKYSISNDINPSSGSRVVRCGRADGQTDRHDEANIHFSQFANEPNKCKEWVAAYSRVFFLNRSIHPPAAHRVFEINSSQCPRFSTARPFIDSLFFAKLRIRWLCSLSAMETCINQCRFAAPLF
jgi:hypothetical protein